MPAISADRLTNLVLRGSDFNSPLLTGLLGDRSDLDALRSPAEYGVVQFIVLLLYLHTVCGWRTKERWEYVGAEFDNAESVLPAARTATALATGAHHEVRGARRRSYVFCLGPLKYQQLFSGHMLMMMLSTTCSGCHSCWRVILLLVPRLLSLCRPRPVCRRLCRRRLLHGCRCSGAPLASQLQELVEQQRGHVAAQPLLQHRQLQKLKVAARAMTGREGTKGAGPRSGRGASSVVLGAAL